MTNNKDREPEQIQVEFFGKEFRRRVNPDDPDHLQERRVRILGSRKLFSGTLTFRAADECPTTPSDFPHIPIGQADALHDHAETDRSLSTARKRGASQPGIDVEDIYRKRGGTGERIPIGPAGFFSEKERNIILKLRKVRGNKINQ